MLYDVSLYIEILFMNYSCLLSSVAPTNMNIIIVTLERPALSTNDL